MKNVTMKTKIFAAIAIAAAGFILAAARPGLAQQYRATVTFQSIKVVDTAFPNQPANLAFTLRVGSQSLRLPTGGQQTFPPGQTVPLSGIQLVSEFDGQIAISARTSLRAKENNYPNNGEPNVPRDLVMLRTYSVPSNKWGTTVTQASNNASGHFEITYRLELQQISGPVTTPLALSINLRDFASNGTQDKDEGDYTGDEPYLFLAAVYVDGTTITRTELVDVDAKLKTHGNLAHSGVDSGNNFQILPATGVFETRRLFPIVNPANNQLLKDDTKVILIVIAMEEDETLASSIEAGRQKFVERIKEEAKKIVQDKINQVAGLPSLDDQIAAAAERMKQTVHDTVEAAERSSRNDAYLWCCVNQDDYIAHATAIFSYAQLEQAGIAGCPIQMDFTKTIPAKYGSTYPNLYIPEHKVKYSITGTISGIPLLTPSIKGTLITRQVFTKPIRN